MAATALNANKLTIVNGDDMANAIADPTTTTLVKDAVAFGTALHAAGKDHSMDILPPSKAAAA